MIVMTLNSGGKAEDLRMLAEEVSRICPPMPVKLYQQETGELYIEWFKNGDLIRLEIKGVDGGGRKPVCTNTSANWKSLEPDNS